MSTLVVKGGKTLSGSISISGNKNSVLPCIAACLLTDDQVILENVPNISDVQVMIKILNSLGAKTEFIDHTLSITASGILRKDLPEEFTQKLRASVLLVGPMLARFGKVNFYHPGGDVIGKRSIDIHLEGFKRLGYVYDRHDIEYHLYSGDHKPVSEIFLDEASCTATENIILTSVLGNHSLIVKNCAKEPQIVDLCMLLNKMGAKIEGAGQTTLAITGVKKLSGARFRISQDYIEMCTYAVAAALTGGTVSLKNCSLEDMEPIINPLSQMGLVFRENGSVVHSSTSSLEAIAHLKTNIWPGFPSDFMSPLIVLATQAKGVSLLHDWMYESRMFFVDKLINMGAQITIADPHRVLVYGPSPLYGRVLESPDIRAGMAMLLAALCAKGESIIKKAELIDRGYEDVEDKLISLGADISRNP